MHMQMKIPNALFQSVTVRLAVVLLPLALTPFYFTSHPWLPLSFWEYVYFWPNILKWLYRGYISLFIILSFAASVILFLWWFRPSLRTVFLWPFFVFCIPLGVQSLFLMHATPGD